jgi:hypothetical protein
VNASQLDWLRSMRLCEGSLSVNIVKPPVTLSSPGNPSAGLCICKKHYHFLDKLADLIIVSLVFAMASVTCNTIKDLTDYVSPI